MKGAPWNPEKDFFFFQSVEKKNMPGIVLADKTIE